MQVVGPEIFSIFEVCDELDYIMCGSPMLSLEDWKENTVYRETFNAESEVVKWFW